jgi:hypothetical protein
VQLAFFYRSSHAGKPVALFPSPAGATESEVEQGPWNLLAASHPVLSGMREDVEALLVSRLPRTEPEVLLAPIDRCFELVGLLREKWRGINGGDEVWPAVRAFVARLKERAV